MQRMAMNVAAFSAQSHCRLQAKVRKLLSGTAFLLALLPCHSARLPPVSGASHLSAISMRLCACKYYQ